jgi:DNA-binding CsgD family transcriptional regulator
MKGAPDILAIVEAAYQIDAPDDVWLARLAEAARPHLDEGFGLAAFEFHRSADGLPHMEGCCRLGIPDGLAAIYETVFERMDPEIQRRPFRLGPCITGSQLMGMRAEEFREHPYMKAHAQRFGMYDSLWITATDPTGRGLGFHAGRSKVGWASASTARRWGQIAAHLSAAARLRHRLRTPPASQDGVATGEAVLDPHGKLHDASGVDDRHTIDVLRDAVKASERSRGPLRTVEPDASLAGWRALVAGRWSLVDQIDHGGHRYIIARKNDPAAAGPAALTAREKQVIGYARLGHHNKLIAYDLGIADSTVRVLLARAAAKLGVRTREELLRACADSGDRKAG